MPSPFDEIIDRRGSNSLKYDFAVERGRPADALPLWVADMDFRAPQAVLDTLRRCAAHGIFGYSEGKEDYFRALEQWFGSRYGYHPEPEWLVKTPGVVVALALAVRALSREGDAVLIQSPVYYPYFDVIRDNGRRVVCNSLVLQNGRYEIDFADFEAKLRRENVKLFLLCSPHNPVGRVWKPEELTRMGKLCLQHGVPVVSDEIHCDIVFPGHRHTVFSTLSQELAQNTVLCTAPSKTFNIAGLQVANNFIPNPALRRRFQAELNKIGYSQLNTMGLAACQAAYAHGGAWLEALLVYLGENLAFVRQYLQTQLPWLRLIEPEGTYLLWLDCSALGLTDHALNRLILEKAKLWLDRGSMFGEEGAGFQRMNAACPRALLARALEQLQRLRSNARKD
ncbi:MAG: pyridoxal phosphate-dependent aminotransferase [Oscillospiraceae bacterium]|nr:pyridoxal phosphate-dependent aminotransferase [Oscillospiraceae bacterium]